jgi:hypothetical protein
MARYILIDNDSGYIFGDTADINGECLNLGTSDEDIIGACRAFDETIQAQGRRYAVLSHSNIRALASNESGYLVYRSDINGSDQMTSICQETIEAVERDCRLVAVVRCADEAEGA